MAKELEVLTQVVVKKLERCRQITISAPYNEAFQIAQEYEIISTLNGNKISPGVQSAVYTYTPEALNNVTIQLPNGKVITGNDVMTFFYIFNDNREALLNAANYS